MRQLNLIIDKQIIAFYFDDTFCQEATNESLERIMVNCYLEICRKYPEIKSSAGNISVYIKNALLLPSHNNEQIALLQYAHTIPPKLRTSLKSKPIISRVKLTPEQDFKYTFEPKPNTVDAEEDINLTFSGYTQQAWESVGEVKLNHQAKIIKSQMILAKEPISILAPDDCSKETVINVLSAKLIKEDTDKTLALHLKNSRHLMDEIRYLPESEANRLRYKQWVDANIGANIQLQYKPELSSYIQQQKAWALKQILEDKQDQIRTFVNQQYHSYSEAIKRASPTECQIAISKESYIRKNIIAAMYAGARDYYFSLLPEPLDLGALKQNPHFFEKRKSFNEKFKDIAEISADTLMLTPLETCMNKLANLPLTSNSADEPSLESFINETLMRCAHINSGNTTTISYAEAFNLAKCRLNYFNTQTHLIQADNIAAANYKAGSLFKPVCAPGDGAIRNTFKTFGRVMDSFDSLARKLGSDSKQFEFETEIAALKTETSKAEDIFLQKLAAFKEYISKSVGSAQDLISKEDESYKSFYNKANDNIRAYNDLFEHSATIRSKIEQLNQTRDEYRAKLNPYFVASEKLAALARKYGLSSEQASTFETTIIGETAFAQLNHLEKYLGDVNGALPDCKRKMSELVEISKQADSMLNEGKRSYKHQASVDAIEKTLRDCHRGLEDISSALSSNVSSWNKGKAGIDAFSACDLAIENINNYRANLAARKFDALYVPGKNPILAAIELYRAAADELQQLKDADNDAQAALKRAAPHDITIISVITQNAAAARTSASAQLAAYKKDLYDLLLCNLAANAVRNFNHWQKAGSIIDNKIKVIDQGEFATNHYKVPETIFKLSTLINKNKFENWGTEPDKARELLAALATDFQTKYASREIKDFRAKLSHLAAEINDGEAHDVEALNEHLQRLNRTSRNKQLQSPIVLHAPKQYITSHNKTFMERHPNLKWALVGLAIGLAFTALFAGICAISAFTGGAPIIITAATTILTIGGAGFASGIAVAAAVVTSAIGALIGFFASKATQTRNVAGLDSEPPSPAIAAKEPGNRDRSPIKITMAPVTYPPSTQTFVTDRKHKRAASSPRETDAAQFSYNPFDKK